jgi:hypothetical protein
MRQACYLAPRSEEWVLSFFTRSIAVRLGNDALSEEERRGLLRLLFGLQRFPRITPGLNIHIEWPDIETSCVLQLSSEALSIERAHTRLQYFVGSHHFVSFFELLSGVDRQLYLENWLPLFSAIQDPDSEFSIEDYSVGEYVDMPPLNEQWTSHRSVIYFAQEQT